VIESANPAVGFYGGWGGPTQIDLVQIGPKKHGLMLSVDNMGQGYASSVKILLAPQAKSVSELWRIQDEQDDEGAYDSLADYYDIEAISRGVGTKDLVHPKPENWTEAYRFSDGKYKLLHHRNFIEVKKAKSKSPRPTQK
jgi:hypothetical protein